MGSLGGYSLEVFTEHCNIPHAYRTVIEINQFLF